MARNRMSQSSNRAPLSSSFRSASPLAGQALAWDIAACSDDDVAVGDDDEEDPLTNEHHESIHAMDRRPSGVAYGGTRPALNPQVPGEHGLSPLERKRSRDAERSLLRDNHILPPKGRSQRPPSWPSRLYRRFFSTKVPRDIDEESPSVVVQPPSETSPLLAATGEGSSRSPTEETDDELIEEQWEEAIASGQIRSTWQRESKTIIEYSIPLIVTFFLQYSINASSIFAVGRLGILELGAVSCKSYIT